MAAAETTDPITQSGKLFAEKFGSIPRRAQDPKSEYTPSQSAINTTAIDIETTTTTAIASTPIAEESTAAPAPAPTTITGNDKKENDKDCKPAPAAKLVQEECTTVSNEEDNRLIGRGRDPPADHSPVARGRDPPAGHIHSHSPVAHGNCQLRMIRTPGGHNKGLPSPDIHVGAAVPVQSNSSSKNSYAAPMVGVNKKIHGIPLKTIPTPPPLPDCPESPIARKSGSKCRRQLL